MPTSSANGLVEPLKAPSGVEPLLPAARAVTRNRSGEESNLRPELGHRLAALADGEGCFFIGIKRATETRRLIRPSARDVYYCAFAVKLRRDDLPFLKRMRDEIGLGVLRSGRAAVDATRDNRPWCRWEIARKSEVLRLVEILDEYPLWSKKASDYALWRDAAFYWIAASAGADLRPLADARVALARVREYRLPEADVSEAVPTHKEKESSGA